MKKHIPNAITCCNLISGCTATYWAFNGTYDLALLFIVIGAVFDFFDGMSARLLGVSSPIGKELDSLADDITFGLAPSAVVFDYLQYSDWPALLQPLSDKLPFLAFVMAAFSALRLAKFNLDERQSHSFIGLPTPANALFWGALIVGDDEVLQRWPWMAVAVLLMVMGSCYLLVAEIPMFALKFKTWGWKGNEVRYGFLLTCVPIIIIIGVSGMAVAIAWYVLLSVVTNAAGKPVNTN